MSDFTKLECHRTFSIASQRARHLAVEHNRPTGVRRGATGWEVLVPPDLLTSPGTSCESELEDYEDYDEWEGSGRAEAFDLECAPDPRWREDDNLEDYSI